MQYEVLHGRTCQSLDELRRLCRQQMRHVHVALQEHPDCRMRHLPGLYEDCRELFLSAAIVSGLTLFLMHLRMQVAACSATEPSLDPQKC